MFQEIQRAGFALGRRASLKQSTLRAPSLLLIEGRVDAVYFAHRPCLEVEIAGGVAVTLYGANFLRSVLFEYVFDDEMVLEAVVDVAHVALHGLRLGEDLLDARDAADAGTHLPVSYLKIGRLQTPQGEDAAPMGHGRELAGTDQIPYGIFVEESSAGRAGVGRREAKILEQPIVA